MTVGLDPDNVLVGAANGAGIYVATVGTAKPASVNDAFGASWTSIGYLNEDAVKIGMEMESEDIMAWQVLTPVDTIIKAKKLSLAFTMIEATGANLAMYMDAPVPSIGGDGSFDMDIPTTALGTKYAFAIDSAYGDNVIRFFFDRATLESSDEIGLTNSTAIPIGVKMKCLDNAGILGSIQRGVRVGGSA